jgi:hypothetical protein
MKLRVLALAPVLTCCLAATGYAQVPQDNDLGIRFEVVVIVKPVIADFEALVMSYFQLRTMIEQELPPRVVTDDPRDNFRAERALAARIREARENAEIGDIFTAETIAEFRTILQQVMKPMTLAIILDDNPGKFSHDVNGTYPKRRTLSTMPGSILAALPALPEGVEYRFLARDLILHDTRANVILDRITCAIECVEVVD